MGEISMFKRVRKSPKNGYIRFRGRRNQLRILMIINNQFQEKMLNLICMMLLRCHSNQANWTRKRIFSMLSYLLQAQCGQWFHAPLFLVISLDNSPAGASITTPLLCHIHTLTRPLIDRSLRTHEQHRNALSLIPNRSYLESSST